MKRSLSFLIGFAWAIPAFAQAQLPVATNAVAIPVQVSADGVSNKVFVGKRLLWLHVKIAATAGYVMVFDATALPADGTVAPIVCSPVASDATNGSFDLSLKSPILATNGIVAAFSSSGCDTLTASTTAKFMGQVF